MSKLKLSALHLAIGSSLLSGLAFNVSAAVEDSAEEVERIEVTGSRIKRTDLESAVPITTLTRSDFAAVGALNVADVLNQSPVSITGLGTSNNTFANSSIGLQTTQLRGLESQRTLVLVNGRRFVSGMSPSVGYAVDLNSIPTALIERIDILKSASSAIYGSDAVAGVINIITRKDIEGIEVDVQSGISAESDRKKLAFNLASGASWDSGNMTFAIGFDDDKGLNSSDRDFSRYDEAITLDENGNEVVSFFGSSYPPAGRIGGSGPDLSGVGMYNGDGSDFDWAQTADGDRFNRASFRQLSTPVERKYAAFTINQDINDSVKYFAEVNFNSTETNNSTIEPTPFDVHNDVWNRDRGGNGGMDINSPLIPESLRQNLAADGVTNLNQVGSFVRRMLEFGARSTDVERSTIRIAQGLNFDISDDWSGDVYMSWGRTTQKQENGGQINVERAEKALDVEINDETGVMQCVDANARLQGCVPLDLFGYMSASDAAVAYVKSPATTSGITEQFVVSGSVYGDLPIELPGGNIATAFGIEHRLEKGEYTPGALAQVGASSTNKSDPTDGSFYSNDVFVEFVLPVIDELTVDVAARYSDHEIVGGQTTWNLGAEYSPVETLKLRASAATAVRTPNISELFGGASETFRNINDPCDGLQANGGDDLTSTVRANCLSNPEIAARVAAQGEFSLTQVESQSTGGTSGGNPNVTEETADTYSVGFIWQLMDGFDITLDYYDVSVENAIDITSRTTVLSRCYETTSFDATCHGAFKRDFKGALTEVHSSTSNENNIDTSGLDIEMSYRTDIGPGAFSAALLWNHTREYVITSIADGSEVDFAGEVLNPENRANLNLAYAIDDLNFSWQMRYWDRSEDSVEGANGNWTDGATLTEKYGTFASHVYHDLAASYQFTDTISGTFGIRNVFDKQPPVANQSFNNASTGINTVPEAYDITGRYFNASLSMKF